MTAMQWLPDPVDFRQSLKSAVAAEQADERMDRLSAIARLRLGFVETIHRWTTR